jgi:toxin ParE1/3/4
VTPRFRVSLTAQAEEDLIAVWFTIAERSPRDADRFLERLDNRIGSLVESPDRSAPRPELGRDMRILVEGDYLVIYRARQHGVTVIRVIHGAQDLRKLLFEH